MMRHLLCGFQGGSPFRRWLALHCSLKLCWFKVDRLLGLTLHSRGSCPICSQLCTDRLDGGSDSLGCSAKKGCDLALFRAHVTLLRNCQEGFAGTSFPFGSPCLRDLADVSGTPGSFSLHMTNGADPEKLYSGPCVTCSPR